MLGLDLLMLAETLKDDYSQEVAEEALFKNRRQLRAALFATVLGFILQIFVSLFPMVVYNKVIPNSAYQSLLTVALGMLIIITFDFIFKLIKTRIIDLATSNLELNLQKSLYEKVISWDLQNIPKLTGSSAALTRDLDNASAFHYFIDYRISRPSFCLNKFGRHLFNSSGSRSCSNSNMFANIYS